MKLTSKSGDQATFDWQLYTVMTISIVGQKLQALMFVTSSDTEFLTREPANHRTRSLICIHWWKKAEGGICGEAVNGGVEVGGAVFTAGDRPAACLYREFTALLLSSLLNIYSHMYNSQSSQKAVSVDYMEIAVHCSDTGQNINVHGDTNILIHCK